MQWVTLNLKFECSSLPKLDMHKEGKKLTAVVKCMLHKELLSLGLITSGAFLQQGGDQFNTPAPSVNQKLPDEPGKPVGATTDAISSMSFVCWLPFCGGVTSIYVQS